MGKAVGSLRELGRIEFLLRCHLSERSPFTLGVQQHSVGPLETLPRLPSPMLPGTRLHIYCIFIYSLLVSFTRAINSRKAGTLSLVVSCIS